MKKTLFSILVLGTFIALAACNFGSGTDDSKADSLKKANLEVDTVKMYKQDTCIPEKKVDNSVRE